MGRIDRAAFAAMDYRLGDAAIDPGLWPTIMEEICCAVGATGAALLQGGPRTSDIPRTASVDELFSHYFRDQWHTRDLRARGVERHARGEPIVTDQIVVTPEEMNREGYYNECLYPYGFKWFAGVGFFAGSAQWCLSIQRKDREGLFDEEEQRLLAQLCPRLTAVATLSASIDRTTVSGMTNALELVQQPALVLDRMGIVLDVNASAEQELGEVIRIKNRRLRIQDPKADKMLAQLVDQLRVCSDKEELFAHPILVRDAEEPRFVIRVLPIPAAARGPFLGARVLVTFSTLAPRDGTNLNVVTQLFGLTRAEARLTSLVASGMSPTDAANYLAISRETARNQLKAVFAKTDTHRQSQLVALLSRLRR